MTKEELKHEAEIYSYKLYHSKAWNPGEDMLVKAYLAGAEPREKRIEELIALINAERERQEKCDDVHLRKIAELEKENAELKEKYVKNITDCDICDTYCNSQLTKAKELLKKFMKFYERTARECYSKDFQKTLADTEQFISEVEK